MIQQDERPFVTANERKRARCDDGGGHRWYLWGSTNVMHIHDVCTYMPRGGRPVCKWRLTMGLENRNLLGLNENCEPNSQLRIVSHLSLTDILAIKSIFSCFPKTLEYDLGNFFRHKKLSPHERVKGETLTM